MIFKSFSWQSDSLTNDPNRKRTLLLQTITDNRNELIRMIDLILSTYVQVEKRHQTPQRAVENIRRAVWWVLSRKTGRNRDPGDSVPTSRSNVTRSRNINPSVLQRTNYRLPMVENDHSMSRTRFQVFWYIIPIVEKYIRIVKEDTRS